MVKKCEKNKQIKYLIVDEPDRFMRSIDEAAYFEVTFRQLGVCVWYASDPELNKGDLSSKLLKFTKYLSAEGSNEERSNKSIKGQLDALKEGRYPFPIKPGYKKGYVDGLPEKKAPDCDILKTILINIATQRITPSKGLKEYNQSEIMHGRTPYRMDKFRKIVTDPFYAGIVEMDKQVKWRNENGLHEALITIEQHKKLLAIMDAKKKTQLGPNKEGNPKYPCNNLITCSKCVEEKNGRIVGFDHSNGKPNTTIIYEKYRCRKCGQYWTRQELHAAVVTLFDENTVNISNSKIFMDALNIVWKQKEEEVAREITLLTEKIRVVEKSISSDVAAAIDPTNISIKSDILAGIERKKAQNDELAEKLEKLTTGADADKERFLGFAFRFVEEMGTRFLSISPENRERCKQAVFPGGFYIDANKKVYTPQISPLIRLTTNKKDAEASSLAPMVQDIV